ncbi:hypothetical protein [Mycobacterium riyadhense]|nr:hypothetical protein [Mycobacterium riyadhense]
MDKFSKFEEEFGHNPTRIGYVPLEGEYEGAGIYIHHGLVDMPSFSS